MIIVRRSESNTGNAMHILAVDCCEHMIAALTGVPASELAAVTSRKNGTQIPGTRSRVDLIVIGVSRYPFRRLFISQLRRIYPNVPVLILRREVSDSRGGTEQIRGEFILSDRAAHSDSDIVPALRQILPLTPCTHTPRGPNYDVVRDVIRLITEKYSDPDLNLTRVAKELPMSPTNLSRILNRQVGVSFRQLLRNLRIEEAKRMLASGQYSVKEVAARVGFYDSHYFSRSFKELTGLSASQYKGQDVIFG